MPIEASHKDRRRSSKAVAVCVLCPAAAAAACQQRRMERALGHLRNFSLRLLCLALQTTQHQQ